MIDTLDTSSANIAKVLGTDNVRSRFGKKIYWQTGAAVVVLALLAWLFLRGGDTEGKISYQTEAVSRGKLVVKISATGNLQPTNQVDVGSELSGTVQTVRVDVNDRVRKGQVLATLDTSKLEDQVAKSLAALASAEAKVLQSIATMNEARNNLLRLQEVYRLSDGKVPSAAEMATAEASSARAEADDANSRAAVAQAEASLRSDRTNLSKATVRSPINGVVLLRKVESGQTVAAAMTAPILFTLAEKLSQMELQVAVDEADVGQVHNKQLASFTVDAYPNRTYPAKVSRVGFGSQTLNGVVSYLTVLQVNNDDLTLRPGMTATAEITTLTRDNALLVPSAALRYSPPDSNAADNKPSGSFVSNLLPKPPSSTSKPTNTTVIKGSKQQVWLLSNGQPKAIDVMIGATDGRQTEIVSGDLKEDQQVITDSTGGTP